MARICVVSFRLGGTDGVSIEAAKWISALSSLGHSITTVAGEGDADVILPGLAINVVTPPTSSELQDVFIDADLVIVENLCSLPLNIPARDALYEALTNKKALFHHHDLAWQRAHLAHLGGPLDAPDWHHVTINDLSRRELQSRGISATTIMNSFDCNPPLGEREKARTAINIASETLVLLPTRAIPRKNIEGALQLCESLNAVLWILGPTEDGYDEELADLLSESNVEVRRGVPAGVSIHDAYAACDVVVMPSTWEGFGNPVIESVTHRRPLSVFPYPVLNEIESHGFEFFDLDEVNELKAFLDDPDEDFYERNLNVAGQYFNLSDLATRLAKLLSGMEIS